MTAFLTDVRVFLPILLEGMGYAVAIGVLSFGLSTVIGFFWAVLRWSGFKPFVYFSTTIVTVLRGIPILVQLFYVYFVLPEFGIQLTAFQAAVIGLGIGFSAYQAETFRAGFEAIDHGQLEAAHSIGMSRRLIMSRVILPQAVRIILPPYGNVFIMTMKDSALAATITVPEITRQAQLIASSTFKVTTVFSLAALLYLVMCIPLVLLVQWSEVKFKRK